MKTSTIAGYSLALAMAAANTGCRDSEQAQREAQQEAICNHILEPLWKEFKSECERKTAATFYNGTLADIAKMRGIISEKYNCKSRDDWMCKPTRGDYLPESEFKAVRSRRR